MEHVGSHIQNCHVLWQEGAFLGRVERRPTTGEDIGAACTHTHARTHARMQTHAHTTSQHKLHLARENSTPAILFYSVVEEHNTLTTSTLQNVIVTLYGEAFSLCIYR